MASPRVQSEFLIETFTVVHMKSNTLEYNTIQHARVARELTQ